MTNSQKKQIEQVSTDGQGEAKNQGEGLLQSNENHNNIYTFGCRLNTYESGVMNDFITKYNLENDITLINSCAVTNKTESDIIKFVKKYKKDNPSKKIVFTGCGAQSNPEKYSKITEIDFIIGNSEKMTEDTFKNLSNTIKNDSVFYANPQNNQISNQKHQDIIYQKEVGKTSMHQDGKIAVNDIMSVKTTASHMARYFDGKTRAFVEIQNGCNHRCTFCVIPFARGNSRSVPLGEIVANINNLVEQGYNEVVLTGVDITDYGKDLPTKTTLTDAIKRILKHCPKLKRLRLSSVDVAELDTEILQILKNEPRFMPYFHISLQSGDDMVLKQMARRHTRSQILDFCNSVLQVRPEALFGGDIICGFPTESEAAFQNSLDIITHAPISFTHAFSFSPKQGTPAAKMKGLDGKIIKNRTKALIEHGKEQQQLQYNKMIGQTVEVLTEQNNFCRAGNFASIKIQSNEIIKPNIFLQVKIVEMSNGWLSGVIAE